MQEDPELYFQSAFEGFGFSVTKIAEGEKASPDFLLKKEEEQILVELKTKSESSELDASRSRQLAEGQIFSHTVPMERTSRISKILSKAKSQLASFETSESTFRVVCILTTGFSSEQISGQIEASLYGSTTLADFRDNGPAKHCYFFHNSDFFKYRDSLDAAIVINGELQEGQLLLNSYSRSFNDLRKSYLARKFGSATVDPYELERNGQAYIADCAVSREDHAAVLDYLRTKYQLSELATNIEMKHISAHMLSNEPPSDA